MALCPRRKLSWQKQLSVNIFIFKLEAYVILKSRKINFGNCNFEFFFPFRNCSIAYYFQRAVCKFQHMANDHVLMIHAPTYAYPRKPILQKFGEEMDCQWTITAQADQQVSLTNE